MPMDLSNPSGFAKWWDDTVGQFRKEAIDDPMADGNLTVLNNHVTGPITAEQLAAQQAYPFVWSVPQNHSPSRATVSTDHGTLQVQVVTFAADTDADTAFRKAVHLAGRIVDNVEGSALVDDSGSAHAAEVSLTNFQPDYQASPGEARAQVRTCQAIFDIETERTV